MRIEYIKVQVTVDAVTAPTALLKPPQGKQWRVIACTGHHDDDDARTCTWSFKDNTGGRGMFLNSLSLATSIRSSPYNDYTGAYSIGVAPIMCRYNKCLQFNVAAADNGTIVTINAIVEEEDGPND